MAQLFELSAALTLDVTGFLRSVTDAEAAARSLQTALDSRMAAAAASMTRLQLSAASAWGSIAASIQQAISKTQEYLALSSSGRSAPGGAPGFATGLDYVPYNDFAARLHEGEAVLTKAEATAWRSGAQAQAVPVIDDGRAGGNPPPAEHQAQPAPAIDYDRLAGAIASAMAGTSVQMDGQAVGVLVAPTVSREFGRQTLARQHTTR
ncbi:MAG: hypothetical protein ACI4ML_11600 [Aristaeellaceae bacterium]